jgi:uncharacterized Zn finger protein (UPF0148 family)
MPYCPNCRFEYKEGIKKCPDCGTRLVDQLPEEKPPEGPNFVPLRNLPSRMYAQMLQEALKNEGIASMIKGDEGIPLRTTTIHIPVSKITIWVPEKDVEKAEEIADQMLDHI